VKLIGELTIVGLFFILAFTVAIALPKFVVLAGGLR
jgi:hypothetical protein